jgi:hypothetical protein
VKTCVRTLGELGDDLVLAPERHMTLSLAGEGVPLSDLVVERRERADDLSLVLDTTHARDGILDVRGAARDAAVVRSAKKLAHAGDVIVSRLRPYLRQIALVHPSALEGRASIAVSTEFYVLAPKSKREDPAFLVAYFLSSRAQEALAAAQEGGHHPRVPRSSLFALRVPHDRVRNRAKTSREVKSRLASLYEAQSRVAEVLS